MTAGALALREMGLISSFHWAKTIQEVIRVINPKQPVVVGTSWTQDMTVENRQMHKGKRRLARYRGRDYGGHCYTLNGVNEAEEMLRGKNSHGEGSFVIPLEDFERLMTDRGEVCVLRLNQQT